MKLKIFIQLGLLILILGGVLICLQVGFGVMAVAEGSRVSKVGDLTPVSFKIITPISPLIAKPSLTFSPTLPTPIATLTPTPTLTPSPMPTATPTSTPIPFPTVNPTPEILTMSVRVPILMYHYLSVPPKNADVLRTDLSVTPLRFETHLAYLQRAGYKTISMETLAYALAGRVQLPDKPIIITFDDGYRDAYQNAFPLLKKYGNVATFFVFTQPIDTANVQFLSWDMITEMHQAGMEFGSHSYTHPDMRNRKVDYLVYQILGSKEAIEQRIGEPVRFFCYPAGHYDNLVIKVLDSANFWGAVTTANGLDESFNQRFEMPRIRIRGTDTAESLAKKLWSKK